MTRHRRVLPLFAAALLIVAGCSNAAEPAGAAASTSPGPAATSSTQTGATSSARTSQVPPSSAVFSPSPQLTSVVPASPSEPASTPIPAPPATEASTAAQLLDCTPATLATRTPGVLTLATSAPLRAPWFTGSDPAAADGFEAQIAENVAVTLGFGADRQRWQIVDSAATLSGADDSFDVFIHQVGDAQAAAANADLSTGYYAITDAVVMPKAAADLLGGRAPDYRALRIGVVAGSSGQTVMLEKGVDGAQEFDSSQSAIAALSAGSLDAAVLPTPDALTAASAEATLAVLGQLPPGRWQPEQFHLVLAKDSPLTPCVSAAVDRLRIEGTLDQLAEQWITGPLAPALR